jgi:tetratricopeptide (TPR) repeat protein
MLVCIVFAPAQDNQFLNWDDDLTITSNPHVRTLSADNLKAIFAAPYGEIYNPLTTLSYALEYRFFGYDSQVVHFDNILLHAANAGLVLFLVFLLTQSMSASWVAALLFAVHPLRVESVAWATERKDLLYGFFYFSALISYLYYLRRSHAPRYYGLALLCMILSAFSKGMAVSLPLALLALDFLLKRKISWRSVLEKIPFFSLSVIFGLIAIHAQQSSGWVSDAGISWLQRLKSASFALFIYLEKSLYPVNLSALYPPATDLSAVYLLVPLVLTGGVLYSLRSTRKAAFGVLFFLSAIVMVLPWMGALKFMAADRLSYVALFGFCYLAGAGFASLADSAQSAAYPYRKWLQAAACCLIVVLSALSYQRCKVWRDSYTVMSDVIAKHPKNVDAYINRAMVTPNPKEAIADYTQALQNDPSRAVIYNNRGLLYYNQGEIDKAKGDYDEGIRRNPSYSNLYFNRMLLHFYRTKDYRTALADLKTAENLGVTFDPKLKTEVEKAAATSRSTQTPSQ